MPDNTLKVTPLGGCGEIGMNMTVVTVDDRHYFVDCGLLFPDAGLPGVELILPEITWLHEEKIRPEAWLITHGHEDHIGALPHIYKHFPVPIYASPFTIELIKGKFEEAGIRDAVFHTWVSNQTVPFKNIKCTPFDVNHSIAHALGFFIETRHGNILHTGDWRIDIDPPEGSMTHENIAKVIGKKRVQLLMSDSTNSFQVGTDISEGALTKSFEQLVRDAGKGAVVFTTFASNIWRYQSICEAAMANGRKIAFLGRTMIRNLEISDRLKLVKVPRGAIIGDDEIHKVPKDKLCIICTGSQGEPFSGASRLAFGMFDKIRLDANDTVILSARAIPGNEKSIGQLINQFSRVGVKVVTAKEALCHVSGHAYQEDLKTVIRTTNPKYFMPVHGEFRHLKKHIELAVECGVPFENCFLAENGDVVLAGPDARGVVDKVPSGRDFVCQGGIFSAGGDTYRSRIGLAKNGHVCVAFTVKERALELACTPRLINKGVPMNQDDIESRLPAAFAAAVKSLPPAGKKGIDVDAFVEDLRIQVRRVIEQRTNYKCIVSVLLSRVGD